MIELKNITKRYESVEVLKDVDLRVEKGEFVSILGPSGSGKSTLLNIVAGLLTPTKGEVIVDGILLHNLGMRERLAFRRKFFGFVFQTFNLITYLTPLENVEVPLYLTGRSKEEQDMVAKGLLKRFGLKDQLNCLPAELSVGEQQRVAIARALANNPQVILADEPTGNLDQKTGREVMKYVKELNEGGATVFLVTHDPEMASFAEKKIKIVDGRLS